MAALQILTMLIAVAVAFSFGNDIAVSWKVLIAISCFVVNLLDLHSTRLNIKIRGVDSEGNDFAKALMKKYGQNAVSVYKVIMGTLLSAAAFVMPNAILAVAILLLFVSFSNYYQYSQAKKDFNLSSTVH